MSAPLALHIRPAVAADLALVGPWLRRAGLGLPERLDDDLWGRRAIEDPRIVCSVGVGEAGDTLGFFRLDVAPDRVAEITLLVAPGHRRRGLGSQLLERALGEARRRGLRRLEAVVQVDNRSARAFFEEAGFEPTGRVVPGFVHLARVVHRAEHQPPLEIAP